MLAVLGGSVAPATYLTMNKFLRHGFESGTRFSSPASGYDSMNENMSFTGIVHRAVSDGVRCDADGCAQY